jgi:hypothetical protein
MVHADWYQIEVWPLLKNIFPLYVYRYGYIYLLSGPNNANNGGIKVGSAKNTRHWFDAAE